MTTTIPSTLGKAISFSKTSYRKPSQIIFPKHGPSVLSVLARPTSVTITHDDNHSLKLDTRNNAIANPSKTVYKDNWFERILIDYLSKAVQETAGISTDTPGYNGLVTVSKAMFREFSPTQQRQLVTNALEKVIPRFVLSMVKTLMPQSKFTREFFAIFTTFAFRWLVGPSEVRESEFEGRKERNVVHITKCRFLEEANCIGMCTNLCKMPTQEFISKNFGTPVNMVPNFEDMSCEIIFGQDPPTQEDDPAFKKPCYNLCNIKQRHSANCIS